MDARSAELVTLARDRFGWDELRPEQLSALSAILAGRDVLAVLPNGAGKSAIYQVPALRLAGPTIVVSPLVALQHDQVQGLGPALEARRLSGLTAAQRRDALAGAADGSVRLLYLTPELLADADL